MTRVLKKFVRSIDSLGSIYEFTENALIEGHINDLAKFPVQLAMEELFVNMVHYNPTVTTDIEVTVTVGDTVTVSLVDNGGVEFDVTTKREVDIDAPLEERKPGGLGVHLVQNLVDTLEYEYQDGRGEVIFTKGSGTDNV